MTVQQKRHCIESDCQNAIITEKVSLSQGSERYLAYLPAQSEDGNGYGQLLPINASQSSNRFAPTVRMTFAPEAAGDADIITRVLGMLLHNTFTEEKESQA